FFVVLFLFNNLAFAEVSSDTKQSVYVTAEPLGADTGLLASETSKVTLPSKEVMENKNKTLEK
ncbi:MAG: hypothetical protein J6Z11_15280, partial [Candidatus Riflebacteria bacterium]|nr:hypothetical protein [Candidatus Riflebacteria bacterium]